MCELNKLRITNANNLIAGHLNINPLPGKFDQLKHLIINKADILIHTETKLDETFPSFRFFIDGFSKLIRLDRNRNGGSILAFVRNNIPSKLLTKQISQMISKDYIESNFRKTKWLFLGTYHPLAQNNQLYHLLCFHIRWGTANLMIFPIFHDFLVRLLLFGLYLL